MISTTRADRAPGLSDDPRVDEILHELLELPADERLGRLELRAGGDGELERAVRSLLDVDSAWLEELETPALGHAERWQTTDMAVDELGDYRLGERIGRGGTSAVYLGHRVRGVGPERVAIKLLSSPLEGFGADTDSRRRFEREAAVLSRLSHPNIATIYGGGTSADGCPYLLLEYVEGRSVDLWCAEQGLPIRDRLRLFVAICDAVSHAHGHLIVHRDLKPANILVDVEGRPKLLDFGIAKWLEAVSDGQGEVHTATAFRMLTPEYASPEQLRFQGTTVATDVYALGVVLFELLVGRRPFPRRGDTEALYRAILEQPAPKMSRVASAGEDGDRHGEGERWARQLSGDLDAIVDRCLAKEPAERYASPRELAADIERHLLRLPVKARTQTLGYRWSRLGRRRWRELLFALTVLAFLGLRTLDMESIRQERDRATITRDFLLEVLREASPSQGREEEPSLRQILDQSVDRLDRFGDQPELERFFRHFYGDIYTSLGELDRAEQLLGNALEGAEAREDMGKILVSLGMLKRSQGEPAEAEALLVRALAEGPEAGSDPVLRLRLLQNLGLGLVDQGRFEEAEDHLRRSLRLAWQHALPIEEQALAFNNLGYAVYARGRADEASYYFRRSAHLRRLALGPWHTDYAIAVNNAAAVALAADRIDEARDGLEEALEIWKARDPDHPTVGILLSNLGALYESLGDFEAAETSLVRALELQERRYGPGHPEAAVSSNNLGNLLVELGRFDEARAHLEAALRGLAASRGEDHPGTQAVLWNLIEAELEAGDPRPLEAGVDMELEAKLDRLAASGEVAISELEQGVSVLARLYRSHGRSAAAERLEERFAQALGGQSEGGTT